MNLSIAKLTGKLLKTEKFEQMIRLKGEEIRRYREVEKSKELAEYNELKAVVESTLFQENKKTLTTRKYKDTEEYRNQTKFNKLQKDSALQLYFRVAESAELKKFLAFLQSPDYAKLTDKEELKKDASLRAFKAFEQSKAYKTYTRFEGSFIVEEYNKLKALVNTEEFKKNNAFWANAHRWETTAEYKQDKRFEELKNNADIKFYLNFDVNEVERCEKYQNTFSEEFSWNSLDKSSWNYGFHYASTALMQSHSFVNEQQANNGSKNVCVLNGILHLVTKQEKITAPAWDPQKGFVNKTFNYSSSVIQTADNFRQEGGLFMAKVRCTGKLHHAFWLGGDKKLPLVTIFHFDGKHITMGNASERVVESGNVSGINPSQFFVYSLRWTANELVWYVNNMEVFRTSANLPHEQLYLAFNSFIKENQKASTGSFEVDWVKVYKF